MFLTINDYLLNTSIFDIVRVHIFKIHYKI